MTWDAKRNTKLQISARKKAPCLGLGGITRGASVRDFPTSIGIAGVSIRLEPGNMR